jgi:hypothetical protein
VQPSYIKEGRTIQEAHGDRPSPNQQKITTTQVNHQLNIPNKAIV